MSQESPDFNQMTRREIEDYLIERAMVEPEFRKQLLTEPENLLREIGLPVGPEVKIRVLEEEDKSFYIVLPRVLRQIEELEERDLDNVSGGTGKSDTEHFFGGYY